MQKISNVSNKNIENGKAVRFEGIPVEILKLMD